MQRKVNNTIFKSKQEYMSVLQLCETLLRRIKEDPSKKENVTEITRIRDIAFSGLLRSGLQYVSLDNDKVLQLTIDNINYTCETKTVASILKSDFCKVTNFEHLDFQNDAILQTQDIISFNEDLDNEGETLPVDKTFSKENIANNYLKIKEMENAKTVATNQHNNSDIIRVKPYHNQGFEKEKRADTLVYQKLYLKTNTHVCKVAVFPLYIYENEPKPPFVLVKLDNSNLYEAFLSNEDGKINIELGNETVSVSTTFIKGDFIVSTSANANKETIEKQICKNNMVGYGHVCFKYHDCEIHCLPLEKENNDTGNARNIICVKEKETINLYPNLGKTDFLITINGEQHDTACYWKDSVFSAEIFR